MKQLEKSVAFALLFCFCLFVFVCFGCVCFLLFWFFLFVCLFCFFMWVCCLATYIICYICVNIKGIIHFIWFWCFNAKSYNGVNKNLLIPCNSVCSTCGFTLHQGNILALPATITHHYRVQSVWIYHVYRMYLLYNDTF